jgi:hypothetical protein
MPMASKTSSRIHPATEVRDLFADAYFYQIAAVLVGLRAETGRA